MWPQFESPICWSNIFVRPKSQYKYVPTQYKCYTIKVNNILTNVVTWISRNYWFRLLIAIWSGICAFIFIIFDFSSLIYLVGINYISSYPNYRRWNPITDDYGHWTIVASHVETEQFTPTVSYYLSELLEHVQRRKWGNETSKRSMVTFEKRINFTLDRMEFLA